MHGFVAPEVYGEFVQHMRATGERLDAQAVVAVVPRGAIAFPSVGAGVFMGVGHHSFPFIGRSGMKRGSTAFTPLGVRGPEGCHGFSWLGGESSAGCNGPPLRGCICAGVHLCDAHCIGVRCAMAGWGQLHKAAPSQARPGP